MKLLGKFIKVLMVLLLSLTMMVTVNIIDKESNKTVYAETYDETKTVKITYTVKPVVTFYDEDGVTELYSTEVEVNTESPVTPTYGGEAPTKESTAEFTYEFDKWVNVDDVTKGLSPVETYEDAAYKATFMETKRKYTVTFDSNGGDELVPTTIEYGSKLNLPTPTYTGHKFTGWFIDDVKVNSPLTVDKDYELTAQYDLETYTVKFMSEGKIFDLEEVLYEGKATEPEETPTKEGYTFVEWQLDGEKYDFNTSVEGNITLTAAFKEVVTYDFDVVASTTNWTKGNSGSLRFVFRRSNDPDGQAQSKAYKAYLDAGEVVKVGVTKLLPSQYEANTTLNITLNEFIILIKAENMLSTSLFEKLILNFPRNIQLVYSLKYNIK